MTMPTVIWWCWVGLVVLSAADLLIQGHRLVPLGYAFGGLAITGLVFACMLWPRVIADDVGVKVMNPFRRFDIPWGAVRGIFLADSVEVQCARAAPKKDKIVYSWAISSPRRARARAQLRSWQWDQGRRNRPTGYAQMPESARSVVRMTTAEIMARELAVLADNARFESVVADVEIDVPDTGPGARDTASRDTVRGRPASEGPASEDAASEDAASQARQAEDSAGAGSGEVMSSGWAWPPVLAVVLPAIGLIITLAVT
jgi:hypothetical protein